MSKLEELGKKNKVAIHSIHDEAFKSYGRIVEGQDFSALIKYMEQHTDIPADGNIYVASVPEMEALPGAAELQKVCFGDMPVQIGYCNGRNTTYNGFEYHKAAEINIAVTDFMLVLGHSWDITPGLSYSVDQAEVFYVEKGAAIEMFGTTLHLSPLRVCDEGFKGIVVLPRGVNTPLSDAEKTARDVAYMAGEQEARLLLQRGKWVIAHPDREPLMRQGACPGVTGENRELFY